ncbi:MAG: cold shock domain-containing protein [Cyclobacteriaceae bacterium]|nr:cold shock domain-containing protein [Cyclobacteriaceae bacterium]
MPKSQETWNKKEKEKKKQKKKEDKAQRKDERKANASGGGFENMIAYVDEYGNFSSTPPDPMKRKVVVNASSIEVGVPRRKASDEVEAGRKGIVTFFNESKGFGFIKDTDNGESIFTHIKDHQDAIRENDRVTFRVEQGQKGPNAVAVKLIK